MDEWNIHIKPKTLMEYTRIILWSTFACSGFVWGVTTLYKIGHV